MLGPGPLGAITSFQFPSPLTVPPVFSSSVMTSSSRPSKRLLDETPNTSDSGASPRQGVRTLFGAFSSGNIHGSRSGSGSSRVTPGDRLSNARGLRASPFPVHDWTRRCHCCESPVPSPSNTVSHLSRTSQTQAILPSRMLH
jgi:hypothetical protein